MIIKSCTSILLAFILTIQLNAQSLADLFETTSQSVVVIGTLQNKQLGGGVQNVVSEAGLGSGVLISEDGLIWTAAHVVQVAEDLKVKFKDGTIKDARVLSSSPSTDLALIQVIGGASGQRTATIGNSDDMRIGDDIYVIGAPKGLEYSLSRGVISGKMTEEADGFGGLSSEFIQIDAAINPGNSGGPIFNMQGEVVGIASFILTESGGFEGIGFAATSKMAQEELSANRIYGGMDGINVYGPIAAALNIPGGGYLIQNVSSKGLGAQLGLRGGTIKAVIEGQELLLGGDVITELAGIAIHDHAGEIAVRKKINAMPEGSQVEVKFLRAGKIESRTFTVMR